RDPRFGPMIMVGSGGTYVEAFQDVSFRLAPIRSLSARHMLEQIKGFKILKGFRGAPPSDIAKVEEILKRVSQLSLDLEEITELDINPLFVYQEGSGAAVVDARILL
ncbi:MAG: acetate--CoA ligase family protein, partial [Deltaproteobacteria bacterium]|nr:acetate--CoA ligase family protein [Deltaproteobacteria bacterium]